MRSRSGKKWMKKACDMYVFSSLLVDLAILAVAKHQEFLKAIVLIIRQMLLAIY